jgi:hypothetical protein
LPTTIGAERPPYGARQRKLAPFNAQVLTNPVSADVPSRFGPRASGQSPSAIRRGPCADPLMAAAATAAATSHVLFHYIIVTSQP